MKRLPKFVISTSKPLSPCTDRNMLCIQLTPNKLGNRYISITIRGRIFYIELINRELYERMQENLKLLRFSLRR